MDSDQSLLVPYAGPPLASSQRVEWRVTVRTDLGESPPSAALVRDRPAVGRGLAGVLGRAGVMPAARPGGRPRLLRFEFDVDRPVVSARLHATAQGIYEAFLNGERVGDAELTPGFTQYDAHLQVQTYDVTEASGGRRERPRRGPRRRLVPRSDRHHPLGRAVGEPAGAAGPAASTHEDGTRHGRRHGPGGAARRGTWSPPTSSRASGGT